MGAGGGGQRSSVLPAYAGMIPLKLKEARVDMGAPRVCGDDPGAVERAFRMVRCSPRMRG